MFMSNDSMKIITFDKTVYNYTDINSTSANYHTDKLEESIFAIKQTRSYVFNIMYMKKFLDSDGLKVGQFY